jgi:adenine-specific DNA-methyltransferase
MFTPQPFPSLIKYMGSKTKIIDFIIDGINFVHQKDRPVIDLFAGSALLQVLLVNNVILFLTIFRNTQKSYLKRIL